jgi:hypothetical protein
MKQMLAPSWLDDLVGRAAAYHDVPSRSLQLKALVHLPRLASSWDSMDRKRAARVLDELAAHMPRVGEWIVRDVGAARLLRLRSIPEDVACRISEDFHYLGSHRSPGAYYGAFDSHEGQLVSVIVTADLDMPAVAKLLTNTAPTRVVARMFSFTGAPRNTLSRLLAFVAREEAVTFGARQLVTYVNPQLGFTGSTYRASGWSLLGYEPGTHYLYLDGNYITDRELVRRFGSSDYLALRQRLGDRIDASRIELEPLLVFARESLGTSKPRKRPTRCDELDTSRGSTRTSGESSGLRTSIRT